MHLLLRQSTFPKIGARRIDKSLTPPKVQRCLQKLATTDSRRRCRAPLAKRQLWARALFLFAVRVKTQQHSGNAHLFLTLSQRRLANSLVKLGQVHALSPSNSNKLTESSRPQNVKTPTQNLEPNSNCTTASGQPKESCLRHNFSTRATQSLGRARFEG